MIAFTCHAAADEVHHRIAGLHQGRCELTSIGYTGGRACGQGRGLDGPWMREFDGVIDALGAPERQHATHLLGPANCWHARRVQPSSAMVWF